MKDEAYLKQMIVQQCEAIVRCIKECDGDKEVIRSIYRRMDDFVKDYLYKMDYFVEEEPCEEGYSLWDVMQRTPNGNELITCCKTKELAEEYIEKNLY